MTILQTHIVLSALSPVPTVFSKGFFLRFIKSQDCVVNISRLLQILDETRIHIIPTLNPDGFVKSDVGKCDGGKGHTNDNNVDLDETFHRK